MSKGLTPDEIDSFYTDTITEANLAEVKHIVVESIPAEPVAIEPTAAKPIIINPVAPEPTPIDAAIIEPIAINPAKLTINVVDKNTEEPIFVKIADAATKQEKPTQKSHRRAPRIFWPVIWRRLGAVVTAVIAIVALGLVGLRIAGFRTFTIMSGSMEPGYPVGAMIYVKPTDYKDLKVGDVISFVANNDKTVVTHRIADIQIDESDPDVWRFKTKGDANKTADAQLVHYKNVLGTPIVTIPFIGFVAHNLQQP
ncbi:signal peptidase I, partial [Candidatus Saccharibacteria bacterium]|nr:signal peptidase I [Candidatus Saccharibacteria bacterium]